MVQLIRYFAPTEVARQLGISKQTLIRYERKRIFPRSRRNKVNGWREYTEVEIVHLRKILGRP